MPILYPEYHFESEAHSLSAQQALKKLFCINCEVKGKILKFIDSDDSTELE